MYEAPVSHRAASLPAPGLPMASTSTRVSSGHANIDIASMSVTSSFLLHLTFRRVPPQSIGDIGRNAVVATFPEIDRHPSSEL